MVSFFVVALTPILFMMTNNGRKQMKMKQRRSLNVPALLLIAVVLILGVFVGMTAMNIQKGPSDAPNTEEVQFQTFAAEQQEKEPTAENQPQQPAEPQPVSTASIGVTGDILIHSPIYQAARQSDGSYDFTEIFTHVAPYFKKYDCMVANLEVTLGGEKPSVGKYPSSYPLFNCPDSIVDALKEAGTDLLLTANNHSYDTRTAGVKRTVQVVREKGLDSIGSRENTEESFYQVKQVGDVKVGMACFTYSTESDSGAKSLNGISMDRSAYDLICTFDPERLEDFYEKAETAVDELNRAGAETLMFYIHWGYEYRYVPSEHQQKMAKKLCELGVDVIVGGHPHVIQPFETVTADNGNETLCIYSTGNAVSNQRKAQMSSDNHSGHTEDGMIFGVTFEKWSDGSVRIKEVEILPTWVVCERRSGKTVYQIVPLDVSVADWKSFSLTDSTLKEAKASYNRTLKLVGEGLNAARVKLGLEEMPLSVN